jgi:hypothetical protein
MSCHLSLWGRQYFLEEQVLVGELIGEGYQINSLPWIAIRTSVREVFKGRVCASE